MLRSLSSSSMLRLNENTNVFHQKDIVALGGKKDLLSGHHHRDVWCWTKDRHADQWIRRESLEIGPHVYSQLIFNKGAKAIVRRKDSPFCKWGWYSHTSHAKTKQAALTTASIHILNRVKK